ncbi:MAG: DUF1501 domain-containing protein [Candidatus Poribacteria bacterium]|nr:DUF1501 domain-containing protein [Candidatus Poribacteria bacterium]
MATSYLVRDRKTFMSIAEPSHLVKYFPLMAGGDVQACQAIGETDDIASAPVGEGFTPDDLAASFFRNTGIDPQTKYQTNGPETLVRDGRPIQQLFRVFSAHYPSLHLKDYPGFFIGF